MPKCTVNPRKRLILGPSNKPTPFIAKFTVKDEAQNSYMKALSFCLVLTESKYVM